ncbi:MAG: MarC family protein [Candidatus Omnitrophota bacterium]
MWKDIFLAFIPIFVAVDAIGVLPIFVNLTHGLSKKDKSRIVMQSIWTALCLAVTFIFLGKIIFRLLGITMGDFMVAGGAILFCIAIIDLLRPGKDRRAPEKELGAVPIGTPLIVGPAVLTTSLIIIDQYGLLATLLAVSVNILLAGIIFSWSDILIKSLGQAGSRALSKVMSLLLAAIAIMMIRKGVWHILSLAVVQ